MDFDPTAFDSYKFAPGLAVITSYFNPNHYRTKRGNYEIFRRSMEASGIPCVTVECVFPDAEPDLAAFDVIRIQARDVMWQKERLLNLALSRLPDHIRAVAWLDCDVLFENRAWAAKAALELETHSVVQLFSEVVRLPQEPADDLAGCDRWESFGAVVKRAPNQLLRGDFALHGHTGFAWAARRDLLERHGLYDSCIAGSGDHMMAHAFAGDWKGRCIDRIVGHDNEHRAHFERWARSVYRDVRASISVVPGVLYHLWHGDTENRRYVLRNRELASFGFDPATDLRIGDSGAWEWASEKHAMHSWAVEYFSQRCEDGVPV